MNQYTITLVYTAGDFETQTQTIDTDKSEFDLHHIVAEAFFIDDYSGSNATIVSRNVWQVTMNEAVFIVVKN